MLLHVCGISAFAASRSDVCYFSYEEEPELAVCRIVAVILKRLHCVLLKPK